MATSKGIRALGEVAGLGRDKRGRGPEREFARGSLAVAGGNDRRHEPCFTQGVSGSIQLIIERCGAIVMDEEIKNSCGAYYFSEAKEREILMLGVGESQSDDIMTTKILQIRKK